MRIKSSNQKENGSCGEGKYRVLLYSRRASLVNEFCLDPQKDKIEDLQAAEQFLRDTLAPCDFAAMTVTLIGEDGQDNQDFVQFDLGQPE